MTQLTNQFSQTPEAGDLDLQFQGSVVAVQVSANQVTALVAGQPAKIEDSAGGVPNVLSLAGVTDNAFGFVIRTLKDINFPAFARLELAQENSCMWLTSGGAIARGAKVEYNTATGQVITWGGVNPVIGYAYDKPTASGQVFRVMLKVPSIGTSNGVKEITVTATLAQINAGLTLIPGTPGKSILVTNFVERVVGAFAAGTSVALQSTNATPVVVETTAEAGLTNGAVLVPGSTNVTLGAGFGAALGAGDGLAVANNGSAQTGGTSITYTISYATV